jgi:hypothetical protein
MGDSVESEVKLENMRSSMQCVSSENVVSVLSLK